MEEATAKSKFVRKTPRKARKKKLKEARKAQRKKLDEAIAKSNFVRVSPRKARLVANIIQGKKVEEATVQLMLSKYKSGRLLKKTLDSAVANAETQLSVERRDLMVKEVKVDEGPVMKRTKSKCRGGRVPIAKRMSHFTVKVGTKG